MQTLPLGILLNLSIIIPAITGLIVFKSINKNYRYFIISICFGAINEFNGEFELVQSQFIEFLYSVTSTQLILYSYFKWDAQKIIRYKKILLHSLILLLCIVDQYFDYLSVYHIKWAMITSMIGISFYGIQLLTQSQNNFLNANENLSRKLIIIPYMVFSVYYATINILMHFLFNSNTRDIFMNLYSVIRWINFLSYVSYTLAFIWAPKREKFL